MAIAIPCPHCDSRAIETVRTAWYIRGFLLFAQWGSNTYVGCVPCTRNKVIGSLFLTSFIGWWCFPWGLGTPLVLMQNGFSVFSGPNRAALSAFLAKQGIDINDVEFDASGNAAGQERLAQAVFIVLHRMVWADGEADPREIEVAADVALRMLGDLMPEDEVRAVLSTSEVPGNLDPATLPADSRPILLKAAAAIAAADDVIEDSELQALRDLGETLDVPQPVIHSLIASLQADEQGAAERDQLRAVAADVLGVSADAPAAEIQAKYRAALLSASGIDEEDQANEARERVTWAYQALMG